jgi:hypothetical protein
MGSAIDSPFEIPQSNYKAERVLLGGIVSPDLKSKVRNQEECS